MNLDSRQGEQSRQTQAHSPAMDIRVTTQSSKTTSPEEPPAKRVVKRRRNAKTRTGCVTCKSVLISLPINDGEESNHLILGLDE